MEYTALLEKQILGRLKIDNPWWTEGRIPSYYQEMSPRLYLDIFYPLVRDVSIQRALILMGPRRVGKTVMLYHSIQRLIDEAYRLRISSMFRWKLLSITISSWNSCFLWQNRYWIRKTARKNFMFSSTRYSISKTGKSI